MAHFDEHAQIQKKPIIMLFLLSIMLLSGPIE
jgi:hypothetical protein